MNVLTFVSQVGPRLTELQNSTVRLHQDQTTLKAQHTDIETQVNKMVAEVVELQANRESSRREFLEFQQAIQDLVAAKNKKSPKELSKDHPQHDAIRVRTSSLFRCCPLAQLYHRLRFWM